MNERVNRYLDGECRQEELTLDERQRVASCAAIISEMERSYKSLDVPDLTTRVMERLPEIPAPNSAVHTRFFSRLRDVLGWLWKPCLIRVRPAYGILGLVALLLMVLPGSKVLPPDHFLRTSGESTEIAAGKVFVQFRLDAPHASKVRLAGSFSEWEPAYTLEEITPGVWSILIPLDPGVHNYAFVVDGGQWIADPAAPAVDDGFGGVNSRLSVLLPASPSRL
jgi:hypothetical protein